MVPSRSQRHEPPEDHGGNHAVLALQPLLDLLLVLRTGGEQAQGPVQLL
jgi:hypothetical protein